LLKLFRVRGQSMVPTLEDGDFVIGRRLAGARVASLRPAAVVCLQHPELGPLIKRVVQVDRGAGRVTLTSDGTTGSDASALGPVPLAAITHRAVLAVHRRGGLSRL
jgi:hypothetical protein